MRARRVRPGCTAEFVQDNQALSLKRGTVRALHFQVPPRVQAKLVRVLRGSVYDVAVDLRVGSPDLRALGGRNIDGAGRRAIVCSARLCAWLLHARTRHRSRLQGRRLLCARLREGRRSGMIRRLAIGWPVSPADAVLSDKDRKLPRLADFASPFRYDGCR